jgi:hypothetical protein
MIEARPTFLSTIPGYARLPTTPFDVAFASIPDRIQADLLQLGGVQPVTKAMADAAGGELHDKPSPAEVELFRNLGTRFQRISVVMNIANLTDVDGRATGVPYSLSLIPSQKRGKVHEVSIDLVERFDPPPPRELRWGYQGFDPFRGDWGLFGTLATLLGNGQLKGYIDELGLVIDQYFLAITYDADGMLHPSGGFNAPEAQAKYNRHRSKRLFRPFQHVGVRRVWGAESPIELFLFQALLHAGNQPTLQVILSDDGSAHPSLYHLWHDTDFRNAPGQITEADMYFPDQRLAVFCDSAAHHRQRRARAKDDSIDKRLEAAGFKAVRVPGRTIVRQIEKARDMVLDAVA